MPVGAAIGIGAAITGISSVYSANKQSDAAQQAAKAQTTSANYAADQQLKATEEGLAFQKTQAAQDQANFNSTQQANYNQWAAREQRLSSLGQALGLPARNIPAYQSTAQTLPSTQTTPTAGSTALGQQPSGNLSDPKAWMSLVGNDQALTQFVTSGLGSAAAKPGLVDYYKKVIKGQPGANETEQAGSADFYRKLFAKDPNVTGIAAPSAAAQTAPSALTLGSVGGFQPSVTGPYTPALQAPAVGSLASYARRAY